MRNVVALFAPALLCFTPLLIALLPAQAFAFDDIFYSESFQIAAAAPNPGEVDFSGVAITEATGSKFSGIGAKVSTAMGSLLSGKAKISFVPDKIIKFLGVNPDMVIKALPGAHYFSYIFDVTSQLPIKPGLKPEQPIVSLFKVHIGDPATNPQVAKLAPNMMVQFKEKPRVDDTDAPGDYVFSLPDKTEYRLPTNGMSEVVIHTSLTYWQEKLKRIHDWFKRKGGANMAMEAQSMYTDQLGALIAQRGFDIAMHDALEGPEVQFLFWPLFDKLKDGVSVSTGSFNELFEILREVCLAEVVVSGLANQGAESASMLYNIGTTLPFPLIETLLFFIKDLIKVIVGLPKIIIGLPKNDIHMAIVTRFLNQQFVEVSRILITPRDTAKTWYPPFLNSRNGQRAYAVNTGHYVSPLTPIAAYELGSH